MRIDPDFINPPESCETCMFQRYVVSDDCHECMNIDSHLYAEPVLPGDWCDKYRKGRKAKWEKTPKKEDTGAK